ncbi:MAG TPA: hypothetical protein VFE08_16310 [Candidatus Sulfotelmatobacter sp.]|jgi:hypothetical protein|nr:hypothetical protein [Candidatus Sulfotelmatobacter sp.]
MKLRVTGKRYRKTSLVMAIFAGTISLGAAVAVAELPESDVAILCSATDVVVGKVLNARRGNPAHVDEFCGYKPWDCSSSSSCQDGPDVIVLQIQVSEVLGIAANRTFEPSPFYTRVKRERIRVGDIVEVATALFNAVCAPGVEDHQGMLSVNPPERGRSPAESLSPKLLRSQYVGKNFIFSLQAIRLIGLTDNAPERDNPPGTFQSGIWRMSSRDWVTRTLPQTDANSCPKATGSQRK